MIRLSFRNIPLIPKKWGLIHQICSQMRIRHPSRADKVSKLGIFFSNIQYFSIKIISNCREMFGDANKVRIFQIHSLYRRL